MVGPKIAAKHSFKVEVHKGQKYLWCSCGMSTTQPFCDGSHAGTEFTPVLYEAEINGVVGFCGCKYSKKIAICDGTHKVL